MEGVESIPPLSSVSSWALAIVLISCTLLFPFSWVVLGPFAAFTTIFTAALAAFFTDCYENFTYAKTFQNQADELKIALRKARLHITEIESEHERLCAIIDPSKQDAQDIDAILHQRVADLQMENAAAKVDLEVALTAIHHSIVEIEQKNNQIRALNLSRRPLEASLNHANDCIANLQTRGEWVKTQLAATKRAVEEQEQGIRRLHQELSSALASISNSLGALQQLRAGCGEDKLEENSSAVIVAQQGEQIAPSQPNITPTTAITAPQNPAAVSDDEWNNYWKTEAARARAVFRHNGVAIRDFGVKDGNRRDASTRSASSDRGNKVADNSVGEVLEAAKVEMMVKQRVLRKVELAFEICRMRGQFQDKGIETVKADDDDILRDWKKIVDNALPIEDVLKGNDWERKKKSSVRGKT